MFLHRRALLCLFSRRESPGGRVERRQFPGGECWHCGGHGLFSPQEGDDLRYKVFTRYNQMLRWECLSWGLFLLSRQGWMFWRKAGFVCAPCTEYFTIPCGCVLHYNRPTSDWWIHYSGENHTSINWKLYPLITSVSPPYRIRKVPGCGFPR